MLCLYRKKLEKQSVKAVLFNVQCFTCGLYWEKKTEKLRQRREGNERGRREGGQLKGGLLKGREKKIKVQYILNLYIKSCMHNIIYTVFFSTFFLLEDETLKACILLHWHII